MADEEAGQEESRVRALEDLGVLHVGREERFDRITRLTQRLFGVSSAAVTLIGSDREHIKSIGGMPLYGASRADAFCDETIKDPEMLVVEDAATDHRFAASPLVTSAPHIRFYAGRPLEAPGGYRVGTLCLIDDHPRLFGAAERALLEELAEWVEQELTRSAEMQQAGAVQRALLPDRRPDVPGYEVAGVCVPSYAVGGDFIDWYRASDGDLAVTLGDVMGKGMSAAIITATVRAVMRAAGRQAGAGAGETLEQAAIILQEDLERSGRMVTLCHARLDPSQHILRYGDAGHGLMVLVRADGTVHWPGRGGLPLGVLPGQTWREDCFRLGPGDVVVAFSDGLLDLFGGTLAARDEVVAVVQESPCVSGIVDRIAHRAGEVQVLADDVALVAVRRMP